MACVTVSCRMAAPAPCSALAGAGAWTDSRGQIFSGLWEHGGQVKSAVMQQQQQQLT